MAHEYRTRRLTSRRRFPDVSRLKLTDMFKSLRRQRLRRDVSRRYSPCSQGFPPPPADHAPPAQAPSPDLFTSSSVHYRSDVISILRATEEDYSSEMNTLSSGLGGNLPGVEMACHISPRQTFPASPSTFQLRSASTNDYLIDRLEQHLRQLSLGDASPGRVAFRKNSSPRDIPMDVCHWQLDAPLPRTIDPETSSRRVLADKDVRKRSTSSPPGQNLVPTILITSVDAKHAKPLPSSSKRPSGRMPLTPSNTINHPTNLHSTKPKQKTLPDDPFTTRPHGSTCPPDYNLTFRLPSFPSAYPTPSNHAPETPTPMYCNHFGDCRGELWEVLHPPLVAGRFTLPPFKLPPLSTGLFNDVSTSLPH